MSRLLDHWKVAETLAPGFTRAFGHRDTGASAPVPARYRGRPVWIRPLETGDTGELFVTDEQQVVFDPDDAIANVQLERYVSRDTADARKTEILKRAYYLLKPLMPRSIQLKAQRTNARSRLASVTYPEWPQDDSLRGFMNTALGRLMEQAGRQQIPFIGFWPDGFRWAACFTHDVETSAGLRAVNRMSDIEGNAGIRSTWFIVPERYPVTVSDFAGLREAGHEIGVHGLNHDGRLFSSRKEFMRRAPLINRYIAEWKAVGFRSPALHRNPDWIPDLNLLYDSSFMDTAVLEPQSGGVSNVFPFHLSENLVELPITMPMDHHLINLLQTDSVKGMLDKFCWVIDRNGFANFLYHPDYNLESNRLSEYREVVAEVTRTPGGWVKTAAEVADWWERRHKSRLVEEGGRFRIDGPAAGDGVVWTASWDGSELRIDPVETEVDTTGPS